MTTKQPLRSWLRPGLDDARIARQWAGISGRLDRAERPRWLWGVAFAGAAVVLGGAFAGITHWHARTDSASIAQPNRSVLVLADGSQVTLEGGAKLEVQKNAPGDVATSLQSGSALFDVVPNHDRSFIVNADGVEVRVVGTQFRVDLDPTSRAVSVTVLRGIVEVRTPADPGGVRRLTVGESWSTRGATSDAVPASPAPSGATEEPIAPIAPALAPPIEATPGATKGATPSTASPSDEARGLFEAANRARRAGDLARASALYRDLTQRFPGDPRAKVAALELGRIEMDRKSDPAVAEQALRTASSAEAGSSVQEDALARLVQLYASKGDTRACQDARARYLAAFPVGVHVAQVRAACASR